MMSIYFFTGIIFIVSLNAFFSQLAKFSWRGYEYRGRSDQFSSWWLGANIGGVSIDERNSEKINK